jgi:hypothetical protein
MAYGYNSQGQIVWVDQPGGATAFDPHSGQSHPISSSTPIIAYGPNRNITPGVGWIDPATQRRPPQSSEELGAIYDRSPGGTPEGRAKFIAAMQAPDTRRAPTQATSGPIWNIIRGKLPPGKKYDSQGNIVNTTFAEKFDTGLNNAAAYGGAALGLGAGGLALGALAAGAYGGAAATGGAAASGGSAAAGGGAAALPAGWAPVAMGSGGAWGGAGAAGGTAAGLGGAGTGLAMTPEGVILPSAASAGGSTGLGATGDLVFGSGFGAAPTIGVPAGTFGAGAGTAGAGTATTVGETLAKQAAKTGAQTAAKKVMKAGAVVAPAVAGLYAATRGGSGGGSMDMNQALTALLQQQQEQMQEESPLRKLLLSQQAGMLPSYMKRDPQYQQWLQNSAPAAQSAMNAAVQRPPYLT